MAQSAFVLTHDFGPIPPEKWAIATAEHICPVYPATAQDPGTPWQMIEPIMRFRTTVVDILQPHHEAVQAGEESKLGELGDAHLDTPHDTVDAARAATLAILAASRGGPLETHFHKPAEMGWVHPDTGEVIAIGPKSKVPEDAEIVQINPSVADVITAEIASHFATVQHIHRQWYGDPSETAQVWRESVGITAPISPEAQAWRDSFHRGAPVDPEVAPADEQVEYVNKRGDPPAS